MFITNEGKGYWLKVHEIPEAGRASRGSHIKGLLTVSPNEEITAVVSLKEFSDEQYVFMATAGGVVKKVQTSQFSNAKTRGSSPSSWTRETNWWRPCFPPATMTLC